MKVNITKMPEFHVKLVKITIIYFSFINISIKKRISTIKLALQVSIQIQCIDFGTNTLHFLKY